MLQQTDFKQWRVAPALPWLDQFEQYLRNDYRQIMHRQPGEKTIRLAIQHMHIFGLWWEAKFNEPFEPGNVTNYDLHVYRKWSLEQERVKAATWNSRLWALGILGKMIGCDDLLDGVEQKAMVHGSTLHRSLTDDEYHRLVHALEQNPRRAVTEFECQTANRDAAATSLMLHAGLRVEEVSMLDVADIAINDRSGTVLVRNGKGSKERNVPLSQMARRAIAAWLEIRPTSVSTALFTGKESPRLTARTLQRIVQALGMQIHVAEITPHWLRYTFAKRMERNDIQIETIRDLLGHNSIETTRRYLRSSAEELQSAVECAL